MTTAFSGGASSSQSALQGSCRLTRADGLVNSTLHRGHLPPRFSRGPAHQNSSLRATFHNFDNLTLVATSVVVEPCAMNSFILRRSRERFVAE